MRMIKCKQCKDKFLPVIKEINRGKGKYCSLDCSYEAKRKPKIIKKCLLCKAKFETEMKAINKGGGKYCSIQCAAILIAKNKEKPKTLKNCLVCKKGFQIKTYKIKSGGGKYCSIACRFKHGITEQEKFLLNISNIKNENGCWIWETGKRSGYGMFTTRKGINYRATAYVWELFNNKKVPKGMLLCHHCDNRSCVNPFHLFVGKHKDNYEDMVKKGRAWYQTKKDSTWRHVA